MESIITFDLLNGLQLLHVANDSLLRGEGICSPYVEGLRTQQGGGSPTLRGHQELLVH